MILLFLKLFLKIIFSLKSTACEGVTMSRHPSLKMSKKGAGKRNVLTRAERIVLLKEKGVEVKSALNLPKR